MRVIKIGSSVYKIKYEEKLAENYDLNGQINYNEKTIEIQERIAPTKKQILCHEIMHGMLHEIGETDVGEKFITAMGNQLYTLINENNLNKLFKEEI
jgi:hypothetical protein